MAAESIILDIKINTADVKAAADQITAARAAIDALIASNKALEAQGQQTSKAYSDNAKAISAISAETAKSSRVIQANTQAVQQNADSIDGLKAANKALLKERNSLSTATEEGRAQIEKLNKKYDENSKAIAANSTAVEKQRFNIGNYQSALDGIAPGLGKMTTGLQTAATGTDKLSAGSKAFIATGIGAIIAGVGLALGALMKYFQGSEEGQNKLNKIMAVGSAIMEQFMNVVESLGEAIFNAIENPQAAIKAFGALLKENIINRFEGLMELIPALGNAVSLLFKGEFAEAGKVAFDAVAKVTTGIEDASGKIAGLIESTTSLVNAGIANGQKLADLQAKIDIDERKLVTERAKTALEVSKLRAKAVELEGESRRKAVQEAIALEESLSAKEVELAKARAERAALSIEANGDDKEALNELASAQAAVTQAEATAFDNTLRFRKELQSLNEEDAKNAEEAAKSKSDAEKKAEEERLKAEDDRRKQLEEQNAHDEQVAKEAYEEALAIHNDYVQGLINNKKRELLEGKIAQEEYNQEIADLQIAADETLLAIKEEFANGDIALEGKIVDAKIQLRDKEVQATQIQEKAKLDAIQNTIGQVASLFNKNSIAFKALASAQTLIQTFQSAQAVFTGMTSTIPGPVGVALGVAGAAAAVIGGLKNVAQINAVKLPKLERGGIIDIGGKRHSQGGEIVTVGGKAVAEVEAGEKMVIMKRGSDHMLRNLANINKLSGGIDFYNDRAPRRHLLDGGFVARSAATQLNQQLTAEAIGEQMSKITIITKVSDLHRVEKADALSSKWSELR